MKHLSQWIISEGHPTNYINNSTKPFSKNLSDVKRKTFQTFSCLREPKSYESIFCLAQNSSAVKKPNVLVVLYAKLVSMRFDFFTKYAVKCFSFELMVKRTSTLCSYRAMYNFRKPVVMSISPLQWAVPHFSMYLLIF